MAGALDRKERLLSQLRSMNDQAEKAGPDGHKMQPSDTFRQAYADVVMQLKQVCTVCFTAVPLSHCQILFWVSHSWPLHVILPSQCLLFVAYLAAAMRCSSVLKWHLFVNHEGKLLLSAAPEVHFLNDMHELQCVCNITVTSCSKCRYHCAASDFSRPYLACTLLLAHVCQQIQEVN